MRWVDQAQGVAAIAGILLTTALVVVAFLQWKVYRRQATIMEKQSELIENQYNISKQTQRAFVFVKEIAVVYNRTPDRLSTYNSTSIPGETELWRLTVVWKNGGDTPARNMLVNFNYKEFLGAMPKNFDFPDAASQPCLIGPKAEIPGNSLVLHRDVLDRLGRGSHKLYLWGWAEYKDVFDGTPRRRTEFCFELRMNSDPSSGGMYHSFIPHPRHNGSTMNACVVQKLTSDRNSLPDESNTLTLGGALCSFFHRR